MVEVIQAMRDEAETLAKAICGCSDRSQHKRDVRMILEFLDAHRTASTPAPDALAVAREALRACRRATLPGAEEPRRNVREIVDEALAKLGGGDAVG